MTNLHNQHQQPVVFDDVDDVTISDSHMAEIVTDFQLFDAVRL